MEPVAICLCAVVEFRQIHDFHSQQPVCKLLLALSRGLGTDHSEELILQAVGISKPGSNFKHERQPVGFFLCQAFHGLHQQTPGLFEIFPEPVRQFVLLILSDPFHSPVHLPDDMIPARNDHSIFEANLSHLPKMRIHITNEVFYILSGFKL